MHRVIGLAVAFVVVCTFGCSSGGQSKTVNDEYDLAPGKINTNEVDMAVLVEALGVQYEAYAELLAIFSDDGRLPLFDSRIDWTSSSGEKALAAYDRMYAAADKLRAEEPRLRIVLASLHHKQQRKKTLSYSGPTGAGAGLADWFPSVFGWAAEQPEKARKNIVNVVEHGGDDTKNELYRLAKELLDEGRLTDRGEQDDVDLGSTPDEFLRKLKNGELDDKISLHNLHKDANNELDSYQNAAIDTKGRPVDVVCREGVEGLKAGGESYIDLFKQTVAGGLGKAGKAFEKGMDLAKSAVDKVMEAEQLLQQPIEYLKEKVGGAISGRAKDFIVEKTGLPEGAADALTAGLGDGVQQMVQHVVAAKEAEGPAADAQDILAQGWSLGGVSVENAAADIAGLIVSWTNEATGQIQSVLSPGDVAADHTIIIPGGVTATVETLDKGEQMREPVENVVVPTNDTATVELPPSQTVVIDGDLDADDAADASETTETADAADFGEMADEEPASCGGSCNWEMDSSFCWRDDACACEENDNGDYVWVVYSCVTVCGYAGQFSMGCDDSFGWCMCESL